MKARRSVPKHIWDLPVGKRIRWARESAGLSHDRLVTAIGRSNRGHLIKIEKGDHTPRADLRDSIADATNVPRELFADEDDEESSPVASIFDLDKLDAFLLGRAQAALEKARVTP